MSLIQRSPEIPKYKGSKSSRALKRSIRQTDRCLFSRIATCQPLRFIYGSMEIVDKSRVKHKMKLLATKTIKRILKMQESIFKYGTYIPRNDKEAEASPEAMRWKSGRRL